MTLDVSKQASAEEKTANVIASLKHSAFRACHCFPSIFDASLFKSIEKISANCATNFLHTRTLYHLKKLVVAQFFLQKKIEQALSDETTSRDKPIFLKMFRFSSRLCIAMTCSNTYRFSSDKLLKTLQALLAGVHIVPNSHYMWMHPSLPYFFCYLEVRKLRGGDLDIKELKSVEGSLGELLASFSPLTPTLFYPYNLEESIRQMQLLKQEVRSPDDLPQVSVHFSEQTVDTIAFLIYLARPKKDRKLKDLLQQLPNSLDLFFHVCQYFKKPLPLEVAAFSLKISADLFNIHDSINLLYARRSILKNLENVIGPFRDFNGGLFEKLQDHFEDIHSHFYHTIPLFDFFAEKVFFALYPIETRLSLSVQTFEEIFKAFSEIILTKKNFIIELYTDQLMVVKAGKCSEFEKLKQLVSKDSKVICSGQLTLGGYEYFFILRPQIETIYQQFQRASPFSKPSQKLRLIFHEGEPLSLNPHQSMGDMRCRMVSKLLFEGLIRLDAENRPVLAGARSYSVFNENRLYRFELRVNHWSNGVKVTASDYANSLYTALQSYINHPEYLFRIKNAREFKLGKISTEEVGIRVIDSETLEIELEEPDPNFLSLLAQPAFFPIYGSNKEPKWFNGPYVVREHLNEKLVLEKNPYFWNSPKHSLLEMIEIQWHRDIHKIFRLFQDGQVHWIGDPICTLPIPMVQTLKDDGRLKTQSVIRQFILFFNTQSPCLSSPFIRQALSFAINRTTLCQKVVPHCRPSSSSSLAKDHIASLFEKGLKELGITRRKFPPIKLLSSHQTGRNEVAECLKHDWEEVLGVPVVIEQQEWNIFRDQLEKGFFDVAGTIQDIPKQLTLEYLERFEGKNSWNFSNWQNLEYKEFLQKAKQEKEMHERLQLMEQAQRLMINQAPCSPLFTYTHQYAHASNLKGFLIDEEGCIDFSGTYFEKD